MHKFLVNYINIRGFRSNNIGIVGYCELGGKCFCLYKWLTKRQYKKFTYRLLGFSYRYF